MNQLNLGALAAAFDGRTTTREIMPAVYVIEPTNHCNLQCIMCPNQLYSERGFMEVRQFQKLIDEVHPYAEAILLYFVGESLLHPKILQLIEYCVQVSSARVILSTNATLLSDQVAENLVQSGLDEIILCLDGDSSLSYEQIRRGANFQSVEQNIRRFVESVRGLSKPRCIIQLIEMEPNAHEIEAFRDKWTGIGAEVLISWLDTWAYQFPELVHLSRNLSPSRDKRRMPCADLWYKLVVNWKGQAVLCCHDWKAKSILGDINRQSVREIWNGIRIQSMRQAHLERRFSDIELCRACIEWGTEEEQWEFFSDIPVVERSTLWNMTRP